MRVIKLAFFVALLASWWIGWNHRAPVVAAYVDEREPIELQLAGIDGLRVLGDSGPSPYALALVESAPSPSGFTPAATPEESVALSGGSAEMSGLVLSGGGEPLSGAIVLIERATSSGIGALTLISAEDGTWGAEDLPGGRYRVRAYVPLTYRSATTAVFSLAEGQSQADVALGVALPGEMTRLRIVGPEQIILGTPGTVAVVASHHIVDELGRLTEVSSPAATILASVSGATLLSADRGVADGGGAVRFLVSCDLVGTGSLRATSGLTVIDFSLPPCAPVPELEPEVEG